MAGLGVFLTGTGTDIGKTYVATALLRALAARGVATQALKPVASGMAPLGTPDFAHSDTARLLVAQGQPVTADTVARCTPWRFAAPLSPDLAAAAEGRALRLADVVAFCRPRLTAPALTLIEGAGGIMSPIAADGLNVDLAMALDIPVLLVAGTYLGTISHTLSALAVLESRGLRTTAVVVNETQDATTSVDDTCAILEWFAPKGTQIAPLRRDAALSPMLVDAVGV